jgi:DNA primase
MDKIKVPVDRQAQAQQQTLTYNNYTTKGIVVQRGISILDIAKETITLRRKGREYAGLCCFCDDSKGKLYFSPSKNLYHCKVCHSKGNIISFLAKRDNVSNYKAMKILLGESERTITPTAHLELDEPRRVPYFKGKGESTSYDYRNEDGKILYKKVKFYKNNEKCFCYYEYVNGEFISGMGATRPTLYNLHNIIKHQDKSIYVVEGEKDVESLSRLGLLATSSGSSDSWKSDFSKYFIGRKVCIIPDCDGAGERYSANIQKDIKNVVSELIVVNLGLNDGQDVTDYLKLYGKARLFGLIKSTVSGGNKNV